MQPLKLDRTEALLLVRLIRWQVSLYREAAEGVPAMEPEPFTGEDLDRLEPLLPALEAMLDR